VGLVRPAPFGKALIIGDDKGYSGIGLPTGASETVG